MLPASGTAKNNSISEEPVKPARELTDLQLQEVSRGLRLSAYYFNAPIDRPVPSTGRANPGRSRRLPKSGSPDGDK